MWYGPHHYRLEAFDGHGVIDDMEAKDVEPVKAVAPPPPLRRPATTEFFVGGTQLEATIRAALRQRGVYCIVAGTHHGKTTIAKRVLAEWEAAGDAAVYIHAAGGIGNVMRMHIKGRTTLEGFRAFVEDLATEAPKPFKRVPWWGAPPADDDDKPTAKRWVHIVIDHIDEASRGLSDDDERTVQEMAEVCSRARVSLLLLGRQTQTTTFVDRINRLKVRSWPLENNHEPVPLEALQAHCLRLMNRASATTDAAVGVQSRACGLHPQQMLVLQRFPFVAVAEAVAGVAVEETAYLRRARLAFGNTGGVRYPFGAPPAAGIEASAEVTSLSTAETALTTDPRGGQRVPPPAVQGGEAPLPEAGIEASADVPPLSTAETSALEAATSLGLLMRRSLRFKHPGGLAVPVLAPLGCEQAVPGVKSTAVFGIPTNDVLLCVEKATAEYPVVDLHDYRPPDAAGPASPPASEKTRLELLSTEYSRPRWSESLAEQPLGLRAQVLVCGTIVDVGYTPDNDGDMYMFLQNATSQIRYKTGHTVELPNNYMFWLKSPAPVKPLREPKRAYVLVGGTTVDVGYVPIYQESFCVFVKRAESKIEDETGYSVKLPTDHQMWMESTGPMEPLQASKR